MARSTETQIAETLFAMRLADIPARTRRLRQSVSRWARFLGWWYLIPFSFGLTMLVGLRLIAFGGEAALGLIAIAVGGPLIAGTLVAVVWAGFATRRELAKHNQRFAAWFHRVTIERLGPLRQRFGLREVKLRNERWDEASRRVRD